MHALLGKIQNTGAVIMMRPYKQIALYRYYMLRAMACRLRILGANKNHEYKALHKFNLTADF